MSSSTHHDQMFADDRAGAVARGDCRRQAPARAVRVGTRASRVSSLRLGLPLRLGRGFGLGRFFSSCDELLNFTALTRAGLDPRLAVAFDQGHQSAFQGLADVPPDHPYRLSSCGVAVAGNKPRKAMKHVQEIHQRGSAHHDA